MVLYFLKGDLCSFPAVFWGENNVLMDITAGGCCLASGERETAVLMNFAGG